MKLNYSYQKMNITLSINSVLKDWIIKINDIFIIDDSNKFASMDVFF